MEDRRLKFEKMEKRVEEMKGYRFFEMQSIFPLTSFEDKEPKGSVHTQVPEEIGQGEANENDFFCGRDRYLWLRKMVTLPVKRQGLRPLGVFDFGKTGGGNNSGFESLLYLDRKPYQGVDSNHKEVYFDKVAGNEAELTFMLWSGLEGGGKERIMEHRLSCAKLGWLHIGTDEFYYYAKAIVETLKFLSDSDTDKEVLIEALDAALYLLDWDEDCFYNTVDTALNTLKEKLTEAEKTSKVQVTCVGHTHIDVAWLWRLNHTREKAMRSFSTVFRLMEDFEEYVFLQSQPQLYKYIKKDAPELYEKIKEKVVEGRWEPDGGMWLEADCNISSGESLSRQFLYGIKFFHEEFGTSCKHLWLPDVFGYSWALPQIMKLCGIETFATTKLSWNQINTMPNDLFQWRGIDGSEVLTYLIKTPNNEEQGATYNAQINPVSVFGSWDRFINKELSKEVLISYGYGDGGGGPTRNMLRMRQVMDQLPGVPAVKTGKAGEFFDRLHQQVKKAQSPAKVWDGELYLEYHRGTYTSQANNKKWNRLLENRLAEAELLSSMSLANNGEYDEHSIYEGWEIVLRNQFHDIIPGSSITEVYEDSEIEYREAEEFVEKACRAAISTLVREEHNKFTLFSQSSFARKDLILLKDDREGHFEEDGNPLSSQKTEEGYLIQVDMKPLELKTICFVEDKIEEKVPSFHIDLERKHIETPFYSISWNEQGNFTTIFDKENNREVIKNGGEGNLFEFYEDKPLNYENWDIDIFYDEKWETSKLLKAPEIIKCGSLVAVIRFEFAYRKSTFIQDVTFYSDNRRIDFSTKADWNESRRLFKVAFETSINTNKATYDIQYGHVERPTHSNTSWDLARFEVVGHKWADLSESNYGCSLLNNCKYGYSAKDGILRLSLLKSGKFPDTKADMGKHEFTYSLLPHGGSVANGNTIEEAASLNLPIRKINGSVNMPEFKMLEYNREVISVDAIKKAEDGNGIIIRIHECRGGSHTLRLATDFEARKIEECDILERKLTKEYLRSEWNVDLKPFEIKNFRLML